MADGAPQPPTPVDPDSNADKGCRVLGLFAGIGGIELGLAEHGHRAQLLCERHPAAQRVLAAKMALPCAEDVRQLAPGELPHVDLVAGGFPCQDLSQAGRTAGIAGGRSSLVGEMFRIMDGLVRPPTWLLIENVPFMLQLERGRAMHQLGQWLTERGFAWAYRVIDTRAFGLPQRRQRVILLATKHHALDPREILFADEAGAPMRSDHDATAYGFYWTEGVRGLGWGIDCIPTLKGGSGVGIPSPPAIWIPDSGLLLPDIRDAERLQGFPENWTLPALDDPSATRQGDRWRLVGNAVSVPVAGWVGACLKQPRTPVVAQARQLTSGERWPTAAWGRKGRVYGVDLSPWPQVQRQDGLADFLRYPGTPLSLRAATGFRARTMRAKLKFRPEFLAAVDQHIRAMGGRPSEITADTGRRTQRQTG